MFNWFPKPYIGTILTLWLLSESLGFALQFVIGGYWKYFPFVPVTKEWFFDVTAERHLIVGITLLIVAFVDHLTFVNYPLQKKFILARAERSYSETHNLLQIQKSSDDNVYKKMYKTKNFWK